jgi:hypothetical protein
MEEQYFDFGVTDRLGRKMGYHVYRVVWTRENGFEGQVTRNGNGHQASHSFGPFETETARDAAIAKVVEGARKRAAAPVARLRA